MKHTPGPWKVLSDPCHFDTLSSIVGGEGNGKNQHPRWKLMAEVGGHAGWQEQEANARLIAAAPDLLEACINALASGLPDIVSQSVQAAIAKATGEQP